MGIQGVSRTTFPKVGGLSLTNLYDIIQNRRINSGDNMVERKPTIDVDASVWAFIYSFAPGMILGFSTVFALAGFDVNLVLDPSKRHHSKRATVDRKAKSYRENIKWLVLKQQLSTAIQSGQNQFDIENLQKKVKAIEAKKIRNALATTFTSDLQALLQDL
jgi:hypothetical protein